MKTGVLQGLKHSLLLFLWLLLLQFISSLLTVVVTVIFGVFHLMGPTPLWEQILHGVLTCLLWFYAGWFMPCADQLRPGGTVAVLTIWTVLTSFMQGVYLLFLPQQFCGGMLRQIFLFFQPNSSVLLDYYWGFPIGCILLSVALGVGLLLRRKHPKASHKTRGENA